MALIPEWMRDAGRAVGSTSAGVALAGSLFEFTMAVSCENAQDEAKADYKKEHPKASDKEVNDFIARCKARCKYYQS